MKRLDGTEIPAGDVDRFRALVDSHRWIFAKTYAAFCPHEYTLKRQGWTDADLKWFVEFIWAHGFDAQYGNSPPKRYLIDLERGWYYFIFPDDTDGNGNASGATTLVNRASLKEWVLIADATLFGTVYRWQWEPNKKSDSNKFDFGELYQN